MTKAMNRRFPDPALRAAGEAAAKRERVSLQDYILSVAYARATAVDDRILDASRVSMSRSGDAFADEAGTAGSGAQQCEAEFQARCELEEQQERGYAA
ncbi:hypothetical protein ACH40D_46285 [Streptomyces olivaceoviridis]|nr:hypothetical protein [Streptomyces corchorusii]